MSKFTDTVKQDTPRLAVMFKREGDREMFQWGIVGEIPLLTLIGCLVRVPSLLELEIEECPESGLVLSWHPAQKRFELFVHPDIPMESLIGMLETIKQTLVTTNMARAAAAQQMILGPNGRPVGRIH